MGRPPPPADRRLVGSGARSSAWTGRGNRNGIAARLVGAVLAVAAAGGAITVIWPDGAVARTVATSLADAFGWLALPWCVIAAVAGAVLASGPVAWCRPVVTRLGGTVLLGAGLAAGTATSDPMAAPDRFLDAATGSGSTGTALRMALEAVTGAAGTTIVAVVSAIAGALLLAGIPRPWWRRLGRALVIGGNHAARRGGHLAVVGGAAALRVGARATIVVAIATWNLACALVAASGRGMARLWRVATAPRPAPSVPGEPATDGRGPATTIVGRTALAPPPRVGRANDGGAAATGTGGPGGTPDALSGVRAIRSGKGGVAATPPARARGSRTAWQLPSISMLSESSAHELGDAEIAAKAATIERTLGSFNIPVTVREARVGPTVTQFSLVPGDGVPVKSIKRFEYDLQLRLAAKTLRIELPVPGRPFVGIEIPNDRAAAVGLREVLESREFVEHKGRLRVGLGRDVDGRPRVGDLARMPHVLIAGQTGAGKSVCLNTIVASLLCYCHPDELNLLMIDPKQVELAEYEGIPHLRYPVVTDLAEAGKLLLWLCDEMERRYGLLSKAGYRHLDAYNRSLESPDSLHGHVAALVTAARPDEEPARPLPYIVLVIDELADLMMFAPDDVEPAICRLTAKARAVGIHLVVATQRPSVNVVTGLIKANIPSRIAFAVASQVDSRVILDTGGAEALLGRGDMLYLPYDQGRPVRVQCAWVDDAELSALVTHWKSQGAPNYVSKEEVEALALRDEEAASEKDVQRAALIDRALGALRSTNSVSVSYLQRKLGIGYPKAAKLMDDLEDAGHVELDETTGRTYRVIDRGDADEDLEDVGVPMAIGRRGRGGRR